ncbi:MAG: response regulator [Chitinophagales bacterium]|nr:response regulator [Chitinophagales bacterium]
MKKAFNRILIIDDDPTFIFLTKMTLSKISFAKDITSYTDPAEALIDLKKVSSDTNYDLPEIIFLDLSMPVMDGWNFLDEYHYLPDTLIQNCKIFILYSSIDPDDIKRSQSYPKVLDIISKPLAINKVKEIQEHSYKQVIK